MNGGRPADDAADHPAQRQERPNRCNDCRTAPAGSLANLASYGGDAERIACEADDLRAELLRLRPGFTRSVDCAISRLVGAALAGGVDYGEDGQQRVFFSEALSFMWAIVEAWRDEQGKKRIDPITALGSKARFKLGDKEDTGGPPSGYPPAPHAHDVVDLRAPARREEAS